MNALMWVVLLGLAAHAAALIVTESELFRGSREWLDEKAMVADLNGSRLEPLWYKLKYLHGCHLCAGTWLSAGLALMLAPIGSGFTGWLMSTLAITGARHMWLVLHHIGEAIEQRLKRPAPRPSRLDHQDHIHWSMDRPSYHRPERAVDMPGASRLADMFRAAREQGWPSKVETETDEQVVERWKASRPADHPNWPRDSFDDEAELSMAREWARSNPRE